VTTGEAWQFLRLAGTAVTIGQGRLYIDNVGGILAALLACVPQAGAAPNQPSQPLGSA
jgi:hypothetical protein